MTQSREREMTSQAGLPISAHITHDAHGPVRLGWMSWLAIAVAVDLLAFLMVNHLTAGGHGEVHGAAHAAPPPLWACGPFVALLVLRRAAFPSIPWRPRDPVAEDLQRRIRAMEVAEAPRRPAEVLTPYTAPSDVGRSWR